MVETGHGYVLSLKSEAAGQVRVLNKSIVDCDE